MPITILLSDKSNVLDDPELLGIFREFAKSEFNDENVNFLMELDEFDSMQDQWTNKEKMNKLNKIYEKFLKARAQAQDSFSTGKVALVNLPATIMDRLKKKKEDGLLSRGDFEDAIKNIKGLLESDTARRFVDSKPFKQYQQQRVKRKEEFTKVLQQILKGAAKVDEPYKSQMPQLITPILESTTNENVFSHKKIIVNLIMNWYHNEFQKNNGKPNQNLKFLEQSLIALGLSKQEIKEKMEIITIIRNRPIIDSFKATAEELLKYLSEKITGQAFAKDRQAIEKLIKEKLKSVNSPEEAAAARIEVSNKIKEIYSKLVRLKSQSVPNVSQQEPEIQTQARACAPLFHNMFVAINQDNVAVALAKLRAPDNTSVYHRAQQHQMLDERGHAATEQTSAKSSRTGATNLPPTQSQQSQQEDEKARKDHP